MSRVVSRTLLLLAAGAGVGLVGPGCAENRSTLFIVGVLADPAGDCEYTFDPGQPRMGRGLWDSLIPMGYAAPVLVGNQLIPQGDNNQIRSETSRIQLEGAEVRLSAVGGGEIAHFTSVISGVVNPAPSAAPGYYGGDVIMIPPGLTLDSGDYLAEIRVFGRTLGGQNVESTEFVFPIGVCRGCTIFGEVDEDGRCLPPTTELGSLCRPGQDGPTHCTVCHGFHGSPRNPECDP